MTHKEKMRERRIRQLARVRGFTPVPNQRINAAIQSQELMLQASGIPAHEAREQAIRNVAKTLPPTPIGVKTRV